MRAYKGELPRLSKQEAEQIFQERNEIEQPPEPTMIPALPESFRLRRYSKFFTFRYVYNEEYIEKHNLGALLAKEDDEMVREFLQGQEQAD